MNQKRFTTIYQLYFDSLLSFAKNHVKDSYLAEDIVQELFLLLLEEKYCEDVCIEHFLFSNLYSLINNQLNQEQSDPDHLHDFLEHPRESFPSVLQILSQHQMSIQKNELLMDSLAQLPEEEQTILSLFYMEGKNAKEIGNILSIRHATIRKRLERSKLRLRQQLQ